MYTYAVKFAVSVPMYRIIFSKYIWLSQSILFSAKTRKVSLGANSGTGTRMFGQQANEENRETWSGDSCKTNKFRKT